MTFTLTVLGWEVFSVRLARDVFEEDAAPEGITGGGGHNFERDLYPPNAETQAPWQEDRFGFR